MMYPKLFQFFIIYPLLSISLVQFLIILWCHQLLLAQMSLHVSILKHQQHIYQFALLNLVLLEYDYYFFCFFLHYLDFQLQKNYFSLFNSMNLTDSNHLKYGPRCDENCQIIDWCFYLQLLLVDHWFLLKVCLTIHVLFWAF